MLNEAGFDVMAQRQRVYSFDTVLQEGKPGVGEGGFAVLKARKVAPRIK